MTIWRFWSLAIWIPALVLLPAIKAFPASFEALVPGEMLTDEELDPYYGKGVEGNQATASGDGSQATIFFENSTQNNVDEFEAFVTSDSSGKQGFVLVNQLSGDGSTVGNFITINININSVDLGGTINGMDLSDVHFATDGSGSQFNVTGSADITTAFDFLQDTP